MSAIPRQSGDVRGSERLRAQRADEPEPFDPIAAEDMPKCECGGDLVRLSVAKDRHGKRGVRVREEYVVCLKCLKGLR